MKKIIVVISILAASIAAQGQDAKSKTISLNFNVNDYINSYVIPKVEEWQIQGRYESDSIYLQRVNEQTRSNMLEQLTAEAITAFKKKIAQGIDWNSSLKIVDYNANKQIFLMRSDAFGDFTLRVPPDKAESFEKNFASIRKLNPDFYFTVNAVQLDKLTFVTSSGEQFNYDSNNSEPFVPSIRNYDFGEIRVVVPIEPSREQPPITNPLANNTVSDVDTEIPIANIKNDKTFAVIIANENYQRESQVEFANNDGKMFKEYCSKTLGLPENNIHYVANATLNNIRAEINWITGVAQAYNGEINVIFYYAGHGIPDESSKTAYLLPIDGYGSDVTTGYKIDDLYQKLGNLSANTVTVFMDACFSGAQRSGAMLASARGVAIKTAPGTPLGNMVVFSAAQGDETAYPYKEKGHGLFTYFLLKRLQDSKGDVTLGELGDYITTNVRQQSIVVNGKSQTPTVIPSAVLGESWQSKKLK
jgi:hypothetical protein